MQLRCVCLALLGAPWVVGACQRSHRRRADAVAAHVHLLSLGERLAVGAVADDVVGRKALGLVQLSRFQHPQANVDNHVGRALDHHGDHGEAVLGGDRRRGRVASADVLGAVVADQERRDPQGTRLMFR